MYNQKKLIEILQHMQGERSLNRFGEDIQVDSGYLSRLYNNKKINPPTPSTLKKIADNSKGIVTYEELMNVCGHIKSFDFFTNKLTSYLINLRINENIFDAFINYSNLRFVDDKNCDFEKYKLTAKEEEKLNMIIDSLKVELTRDLLIDSNDALNKSKIKISHILKEINSNKYIILNNCLDSISIPIIGKISAGIPIMAEENFDGYIPINNNITKISSEYEYFYLKVIGDSMNKIFKDGSFALIQKQDNLENGEIGAILVNGYDATIKKFKKQDNLVILEPLSTNSDNQIQIYDTFKTEIKVIGKVISYYSNLN